LTGATALDVDPGNAEQARAWDGDEGAYWAGNADRFDKAVAAYHDRFLAAAAIGRADRVLDIGCGTGQTTLDAARAAADGLALGVDLSGQMIALARRLAARHGIANARFEQADAQIHPFPAASFDVAVSRTGTMFFADPAAAFTNIARALRPGGRLALLVWQGPQANEWIRELGGALAAGRDLPAPPAGARAPLPRPTPKRPRPSWPRPGLPRSSSTGSKSRCGSAPAPTTPTASCSACSAGCSTASTTPGAAGRWETCAPPSPPTTPATAASTSQQPGSSGPPGPNPSSATHRRGEPATGLPPAGPARPAGRQRRSYPT
jgi:SAM-dependent methyltransferase